MAISNTLITSAAIPTEIYRAVGEQAITTIIFCNTNLVTDVTISVWMVPAAQPVSDARMIMNSVSIPAGETFALDTERFILGEDDSIHVEASQANIIGCTVSSMATH